MKIMFGAWSPSIIIDLINSGVDMFDSSFPFQTTIRNSALIFDYNLKFKYDFSHFIYTKNIKTIPFGFDYRNDSIIMDIPQKNNENIARVNSYEICLKNKR